MLTQLGHYDAAAMTFKNKYGGLPGDLAQAEEAGLAEAGCPDVYGYGDNECFYAVVLRAGCSGNGNGMFDDGNGAANYLNCPENLNFWYHLKQAGLLDGPADGKTVSDINPVWGRPIFGASAPLTRLRNVGIMVATYTPLPPRRANYYTLGLSDRYDILPSARTKALRGHEAFTIDNKLDDGLPTTGRVLVYVLSMPQCIAAGQYRMADETSNCGLFINTAVLGGQQ
ncbi:MAG: hypothetical protein BroJett003_01590 [Planctomycetota bacterium]|nr:MAG: hypothetical protein BroJett003_01590 [Planctomycetota bacterium]